MLTVNEAAKKALKENPGMKIREALDVGNKYVFSIVPESAKPGETYLDPYQAVDKNTGKVSGFAPMMDIDNFVKALEHPIDLAED